MVRPLIDTGHRMPRGGDRCDFCGVARVSRLYACKDFTWEGQGIFGENQGRWASCYECSTLIDEGQWGRLSVRVMREIAKRKGVTAVQLQHMKVTLRDLHRGFGDNIIPGESLGVHRPRYQKAIAGL